MCQRCLSRPAPSKGCHSVSALPMVLSTKGCGDQRSIWWLGHLPGLAGTGEGGG